MGMELPTPQALYLLHLSCHGPFHPTSTSSNDTIEAPSGRVPYTGILGT